MHFRLFLGAVAASILTTEAAPKARSSESTTPVDHAYVAGGSGKTTSWRHRQVRGRYTVAYNGTNTTVPQLSATGLTYLGDYPNGGELSTSHGEHLPPTDCPTSVVVSTTTLEVTVYVSEDEFEALTSMRSTTFIRPTPSNIEGHSEVDPITTAGYGNHETPDTDENDTLPYSPEITGTISSGTDHYHAGTVVSANSTTFSTYPTVEYPHGPSARPFTTTRYWNVSSATSSRQLASSGSLSSPSHTAEALSTTEYLPNSTKDCVIDTTIMPGKYLQGSSSSDPAVPGTLCYVSALLT